MLKRLFSMLVSLIVLTGTVVVPAAPSLAAEQPVTPELQTLAAQSDAIIVGRVLNLSSIWNTERTRISTYVAIHVEDTVKGDSVNTANLLVPGGTVDGITEWVSDAPFFTDGERVLVLLKKGTGILYEVYGQIKGKFSVVDGMVEGLPLAEFEKKLTTGTRGVSPSVGRDNWVEVAPEYLNSAIPNVQTNDVATRAAGWTNIIDESFEGTFPPAGWFVAGTPTWGKSGYTYAAGSYSAWCAGSSGTSPTAGYSNNMNAWLVYGPFDLSGTSAAELSFYNWVKTESVNDSFSIFMSIDGSQFYGYGVSGQYSSWGYSGVFDLRAWPTLGNLTGQSSVYLAFRFFSNSSITDTGVFIDDVLLTKYVGTAPQVTDISPSEASAGTDSHVTITGTGFGSSEGTVQFFYKSGQPYIPGVITSWSDTSIVTDVPTAIVNSYPASASSGPLYVVNSDGVPSAGTPFTVTFSNGGIKWAGSSPVVNFYVNPNTSDCTGEETAVQNAASSWTNVTGKSFNFNYVGATAVGVAGFDGSNEILWSNSVAPGVLAHALMWGSGNTITEVDIEFNDNYIWDTSGTPAADRYDVETIAIHELGHWLNLRDLYGNVPGFPQDTAKIMYGFGSTGQVKRTLTDSETAGIRWIYPQEISTSTTSLASSVNPSVFSQSVTLTATVSSGSGTPTGTVTFKDGTNTIGTGTLNGSGQASYTTQAFSVGSHSLTAVYEGDGAYSGSTSPAVSQTVNLAPSSLVVTSDPNPSDFGQEVTFTAAFGVVAPASEKPTQGTVTFKDGVETLGTGGINGSGMATYTMSSLAPGSHDITVVFDGDAQFTAITSPVLTQTVGPLLTLTVNVTGGGLVNKNPDKISYSAGESVVLTATADVGWVFSHWDGDVTGTANPVTITMNADKTVTAVFTQAPLLSGMESWWPLDGNANDVVGTNHGSLQGGVAFGAGRLGQGVTLDGVDDFVDFGQGAGLNFGTGDYSVSLWVKFADMSGEQVVIEKYVETENPDTRAGWSLTKLSDNSLRFGGAGGGYMATIVEVTNQGITAGNWAHLVVVRHDTSFTLYFNGSPVATGTTDILVNFDSSSSLKLGHRGNPSDTPGSVDNRGFYLNGSFDEVKIFNRALSLAEVQMLASGVTTIGIIGQNPSMYSGQVVMISGQCLGWPSGYGSPPVSRSDFVVSDATGAIYVTGMTFRYPDDVGQPVEIIGVIRLKDGIPYIEVPRRGR